MSFDFLPNRFKEFGNQDAIIWCDKVFSYQWLLEKTQFWHQKIKAYGIMSGNVVALKADFSPNAVSLFLALMESACVIVPLANSIAYSESSFLETAQCEFKISIDSNDDVRVKKLAHHPSHEYYRYLAGYRHPGLVLFSSGSTGSSKAALHDLHLILERFSKKRKPFRSITFLLYDHIGGINTMLYLLANGGCMVTVQDRTPATVLECVAKYGVELLPTSPTFINLILFQGAYQRYDLSNLKVVTYGTEPMQEVTLKKFHQLFPHIELRQTYGLSEIGIMQTKSKHSDSLWVKVGGDGFKTRIVDGLLQVKARSAMLGYLNHPDPFTADGWMITGDRVEQDGEFIKFVGRESEIINVGGEKVYPVSVENVIQSIENVEDVAVYGIPNAIMGQVVCADIKLHTQEDKKDFIVRLKKECQAMLNPFMVPVKINLVSEPVHNIRFKKIRKNYV